MNTAAAPRPWRRRLRRAAAGLGVVVLVGLAVLTAAGWKAFGHRPTGERRARMERSPQWKDGHFENPQPLVNDAWGSVSGWRQASDQGRPLQPIPIEHVDPKRFETPPESGLRITWVGHASMLIEIDG